MESTIGQVIQSMSELPVASSEIEPNRTLPDSSSSERKLPDGVRGDWELVAPKLREQIQKAFDDKSFPVYVCGGAGRGKTFAMAGAYMKCKSKNVLWIDFQPWLKKLMTARTSDSGPGEVWMLEPVKEAFLVCIDDCGIRSDSEAQHSAFLEILNLRRDKPTIITGNHEPQSLHKVFDSRIASRLMEGVILKLTGPDRRMLGKKVIEIAT